MDELEIGSVVIFDDKPVSFSDISLGIKYTIDGIDQDGDPWFFDDVGEVNYAASEYNQSMWHKVE